MIQIFFKDKGNVAISQSLRYLDSLGMDDVVWIDLFSPDGEEKRAVESFLDTSLSSRAQAEEIESSSRYSETESSISVNTNFLLPGPDEYSMESVSFVLCEGIIVSIRNAQLRSFTDIQRRVQIHPRLYPTGFHILFGIIENRIDLDADMIELISKEIDTYSKKVSTGKNVNEEFLLDINQLQENTMLVRENVVDKQRMVSSMMKSDKLPRDIFSKLAVINKDIVSLLNHTNFSFERLDYLQNTVLGLINLDQNRIMKIFTFVSLVLMPPTLVASVYGMNVKLPVLGGFLDFIVLLSIMALTILAVVLIFKRKRML